MTLTRREIFLVSLLPFMGVLAKLVAQRATRTIVTSDIIGTMRPQGLKYDIGAYEFIGMRVPPATGVKIV